MGKWIYLLIVVFLLLTSVAFAITPRDAIFRLLPFYEEECYSYDWIYTNITQYYCSGNVRYLMICPDYAQKDYTTNRSELDCNCPKENVAKRNITELFFGDCDKYILVRKVRK